MGLGLIRLSRYLPLLALPVLLGCPKEEAAPPSCSTAALETALNQQLMALTTPTVERDFTYQLERSDGRRFSYARGSVTSQSDFESASTSKLVSAVVILRAVQASSLTLTSHPHDVITTWPISASDSLYPMTLGQLLAFTSGLESEPVCLNASGANFETCVNSIATANSGNGQTPGASFYYSGSHLQVAGWMAAKASGKASWNELFQQFQTETGLFANSAYNLPSTTNPRLAGGMTWKPDEYLDFLSALRRGQLLNTTLMAQLLSDKTAAPVTIGYSPLTTIGEEWHYGQGLWHECQSATWNCSAAQRVSSPGAYGSYPFWDIAHAYVGLVAQQGPLGSYPDGLAIERAVRSAAEAWAMCR